MLTWALLMKICDVEGCDFQSLTSFLQGIGGPHEIESESQHKVAILQICAENHHKVLLHAL